MTQRRQTWKQCGKPLRVTHGSGRPRVYCSPARRYLAYEARRAAEGTPRPAPVTVGHVQRLHREWDAHSDMRTCVDQVLDSPQATQDLMTPFVVRTATGLILEDLRYQGAVNALAVAHRMIGRITDGDFTLPAVKV